jgi:hypothetical protein
MKFRRRSRDDEMQQDANCDVSVVPSSIASLPE